MEAVKVLANSDYCSSTDVYHTSPYLFMTCYVTTEHVYSVVCHALCIIHFI